MHAKYSYHTQKLRDIMNLSEITDISVTLNVAIVSQIYAYVQNYQNNALNMHRFLCTYCSSIKLLKKNQQARGIDQLEYMCRTRPDQNGSPLGQ